MYARTHAESGKTVPRTKHSLPVSGLPGSCPMAEAHKNQDPTSKKSTWEPWVTGADLVFTV